MFWNTLCSLDGKDLQQDAQKLKECITLPRYLYRYRPVTLSTIDALQRNRLYYSNANYYDDPFDTLIHIDFDIINERARQVFSAEDVRIKLRNMAEQLMIDEKETAKAEVLLNNLSVDEILTGIDKFLQTNIQSILKQNLWSVCFCESGKNENMWLKYADEYKGYCVIYDLKDDKKLLCGKQDKCKECVVNKTGISIYPMNYSDQGYDATVYAANLTIAAIAKTQLIQPIADAIIQSLPSGAWEQEKITLIKSECHETDQEWRMLLRGYSKPPVMQEWIPYGIILGLRTTDNDKDIIIRSAKSVGIEHIYESYINKQYHLDIRELEE